MISVPSLRMNGSSPGILELAGILTACSDRFLNTHVSLWAATIRPPHLAYA